MENNYQILDIFPIPLYKTTLSKSIKKLIPFIDSLPLEESFKEGTKTWGVNSQNKYILSLPQLEELSNNILHHVNIYKENILNYDCSKFKFTQSWVSNKHPNQQHYPHSHDNSIISGVFYYKDIQQTTSYIDFHKDRSLSSLSIPTKQETHFNNPYSTSIYRVQPTPGTLLLFPSTLIHSVSVNVTNEIRKSIAFNTVPIEGFGNESSLTRLKFN